MEKKPKDLNRIAKTKGPKHDKPTSPMSDGGEPKGPKQDSQHLLTSPMSNGGNQRT